MLMQEVRGKKPAPQFAGLIVMSPDGFAEQIRPNGHESLKNMGFHT